MHTGINITRAILKEQEFIQLVWAIIAHIICKHKNYFTSLVFWGEFSCSAAEITCRCQTGITGRRKEFVVCIYFSCSIGRRQTCVVRQSTSFLRNLVKTIWCSGTTCTWRNRAKLDMICRHQFDVFGGLQSDEIDQVVRNCTFKDGCILKFWKGIF